MINNTMLASISSRHILRKYQHFTAGNETTSVSAALKLLFIVNMLRNKLFCLYHFVYFLHAAVVITISITTVLNDVTLLDIMEVISISNWQFTKLPTGRDQGRL